MVTLVFNVFGAVERAHDKADLRTVHSAFGTGDHRQLLTPTNHLFLLLRD